MRKRILTAGVSAIALAAMLGAAVPVRAEDTSSSTLRVVGTIQAMSGTTIPATMTVKSGATIYTVEITSSTTVVRKYNGTSDLGEFLVGDSVEVRGTPSNDVANTINATRIKNVSIQRIGGTFKGKLLEKNCDSNSFTFKPDERAQQTVYFTTATKFTRGGEKIGCASLTNGERMKVIGIWRKADSRIDADRVIVDLRTISGTVSAITLTDGGLPATLTVTVKGKSSKGVKASTSENSSTPTTSWTVNVTSSTKLYRHYLKTATIEEFLVGDKVEARGTLTDTNTMNAKSVRNSSLKIKRGDVQGTVLALGTDGTSFTLRTKEKSYGDITVIVTAATKYVDENGLRTFADITVGDKLKVLGTYTSNTKKLTAERVFFKEAQDASVEDDD